MSFAEHRARLFDRIENNSLVIAYAGKAPHANEDSYYEFEVNSQYFYLTGLEREKSVLVMGKFGSERVEKVFIEPYDPVEERWNGKLPTKEEVAEISGIRDVHYLDETNSIISRFLSTQRVEQVYFDTYRHDITDEPDYNLARTLEFQRLYPAVPVRSLRDQVVPLREVKDAEEIDCIRHAVEITRKSLEHVMKNLKPGMMEYQVQADFEYMCHYLGSKKQAFETIAGSGKNGCMMHYSENNAKVPDNGLILLDLGAQYKNYKSDITRTYPVSGRFTERQKEIYNLVLSANRAIKEAARPGVPLKELNAVSMKVLGEGLMKLGLIDNLSETKKFSIHGVSHPIGIDTHDVQSPNAILQPGWVISNEPGLYLDDEEIGIRIEDDLLITEDGCECLSEDIIRTVEEIEAFMANNKA